MRLLLSLLLAVTLCASAQAQTDASEAQALNHALEEAGASPVDFVRALENHLQKYPDTARRAEIERGLVRGAADAKDYRRIALYGERVLARDPNDVDVLEQVANAELKSRTPEEARKALAHARLLETILGESAKQARDKAQSGPQGTRRIIETDVRLATAILFECRAQGLLGDAGKAVELSRRSFEVSPSAEAAREAGYWYNELGNFAEAVRWLADAFTIGDPRVSETDRNRDREQLGEIYSKWKGSEAGLGDIVLASWDRNREVIAQRRLMLKQFDPNMQLSNPMDFTLTGVDGSKLALASLRGKVIVMDFWATWCGPCRIQHPLYDKVKEKFRGRDDVVFLAIDTDEDRALVPAFLSNNKWTSISYYEDGLSILLKVTSIPTTLIFDARGEMVSRMTGFDPDRFVTMLSDRIDEALKPGKASAAARP
ncbi:MAG: TlpA disulfide reductase family protein [Bryobacteraceae bacterium]|jgi:thiol-disulfide isomerase/thioredoxin